MEQLGILVKDLPVPSWVAGRKNNHNVGKMRHFQKKKKMLYVVWLNNYFIGLNITFELVYQCMFIFLRRCHTPAQNSNDVLPFEINEENYQNNICYLLPKQYMLFLKRISAFNVKLCCFSTNYIVWIKPLKILCKNIHIV